MSNAKARRGALEGLRVLDLSQFLSGPRATQLLAEKGAEVIKVEPSTGETMRLLTLTMPGCERIMSVLHRNKKGITLNLKKPRGAELFRELVKVSDVLVENFTYGVMESFGLGYEDLRKINDRLIYACISGFGRTGPRKEHAAFDLISQATGGFMSAYKQEDRPPAVLIGDLASGAYCALGVLEALYSRERTGKGQFVDVSMQDVVYNNHFQAFTDRSLESVKAEVTSLIGMSITNLLTDDKKRLPFWNSFKARDGYIAIVAITDKQWNAMVDALGVEGAKNNDKLSNIVDRIRNSEEGLAMVSEAVSRLTVAEVNDRLVKASVPCGAVQDLEMLHRDPQLISRGMLTKVVHGRYGEVPVPGIAIKLSETPGEITSPGPDLGEHNAEIYKGLLGLNDGDLEELKNARVI